jgi:glucosamine--fructose-6-phosphate aminotransferase (isomerizing)
MCQLAAYIGNQPAAPLLLESLRRQEGYFGGHATGLSTISNGRLVSVKGSGPVSKVIEGTNILKTEGLVGIAHSRLGLSGVKDPRFNRSRNAHPFLNAENTVALIHNGVINNYEQHWKRLKAQYVFNSHNKDINYITDSEVAVHLLNQKIHEGLDFQKALGETAKNLTGMVLLAAISTEEPDSVYIANWIQACTIAKGDEETMFSSSPLGFEHLGDEFDILYAPYNTIIRLTRNKIRLSKLDKNRTIPKLSLDMATFRDIIMEMLEERKEMTSLDIILALQKIKDQNIFRLKSDQWENLIKIGWGDQNQIIDPMLTMVNEGFVARKVEFREEGRNSVPRIIWYLSD